jgi:hypothetical protein
VNCINPPQRISRRPISGRPVFGSRRPISERLVFGSRRPIHGMQNSDRRNEEARVSLTRFRKRPQTVLKQV